MSILRFSMKMLRRIVLFKHSLNVLVRIGQVVWPCLVHIWYFSCPCEGVVGCGKGVMYLTSPGHPTDIGLQLARLATLMAGKGRGECFYFFCFFPFIPVPLSSLSPTFISFTVSSLFSLSLGDNTKWPTRVDVSLNRNTINYALANTDGAVLFCRYPPVHFSPSSICWHSSG